MRKKLLFALFLVLSTGSCNTAFKTQVYDHYPEIGKIENGDDEIPCTQEVIILRSDSTLSYVRLFADVGGGASIMKYKMIDNVLITDSISLNGIDNEKILNARFIYNRDSLVNVDSQECYYYRKYYFDGRRVKKVRNK